jgi:hypothetical protein
MPEGMNDGIYGGGPPEDAGMPPSDTEDETEDTEDNEVEGKSCLIPKSIFNGEVKPGSTITLTVDSVFSDEVECSVSSNEPESEKPGMMSADEELEGMAMGEE